MEYIEIGKRELAQAGGLSAFIGSKAPAQLAGFSVDGGVYHFIFSPAPVRPTAKPAKD